MSMYIETQRRNVLFFTVAMVLALAFLSASGLLLFNTFNAKTADRGSVVKSCLANIRMAGFSASEERNGDIKVIVTRGTNIEALVYQTGAIIAQCPTHTIKTYCAGLGCTKPGAEFVLGPNPR